MPETRHFCPHCEETVSLSTIHRHKQLYYDEKNHIWRKAGQDHDFSDSDDAEVEANQAIDDSPYDDSSLEGKIVV